MDEINIDGKVFVPKGTERRVLASPKKGLRFCIVRTYSAGVFAGHYDTKTKGMEGIVFNSRRLWYWEGANTLSQLAVDGTTLPDKCKFPSMVEETHLKQIIEVIPCTEKAMKSILGVKVWQK